MRDIGNKSFKTLPTTTFLPSLLSGKSRENIGIPSEKVDFTDSRIPDTFPVFSLSLPPLIQIPQRFLAKFSRNPGYTHTPLTESRERTPIKELIEAIGALSCHLADISHTSKPSTPSWVASIPIFTELQLNRKLHRRRSTAAAISPTQIR